MSAAILPTIRRHSFIKRQSISLVSAPIRGWFYLTDKILHTHLNRRTRVVILCKDHVLLVRNAPFSNRWTLPGGGYKANETGEECCQRELEEELKILTRPEDFIHLKQALTIANDKQYDFYLLNVDDTPLISLSLELVDAAWFNLNTLPTNSSAWLPKLLSTVKEAYAIKNLRLFAEA